ncbi:hypothetical protein NAPIS_ORF02669 [Vairimorpha apis BRL 01]|uniref:Uncharacterized protein n=1 Tax=Vairimorpha apis BRL 01 TaxID=1037528 RepID=T0MFB9_9MICR|nr:hypothetical protein NAPIS_ORF02669 [Vairimorpha apis BRL 01]
MKFNISGFKNLRYFKDVCEGFDGVDGCSDGCSDGGFDRGCSDGGLNNGCSDGGLIGEELKCERKDDEECKDNIKDVKDNTTYTTTPTTSNNNITNTNNNISTSTNKSNNNIITPKFTKHNKIHNPLYIFTPSKKLTHIQQAIQIIKTEDTYLLKDAFQKLQHLINKSSNRILKAKHKEYFDIIVNYDGFVEYKIGILSCLVDRCFDLLIGDIFNGLVCGCLKVRVVFVDVLFNLVDIECVYRVSMCCENCLDGDKRVGCGCLCYNGGKGVCCGCLCYGRCVCYNV